MHVLKIMTLEVASCALGDSLNRAAQLMWEHDCGCVPVVRDDGTVVGIVTDRDACMAAYTKGAPLADIAVSDVMTREVESCAPDENIEAVERRMQEHQIRRMPVVEGGQLVGMVSLNDIALAAERWRGDYDGPRAHDVAQTLARIGHHRQPSIANAE